jgi:xanthine dehydrogenase accessory factor
MVNIFEEIDKLLSSGTKTVLARIIRQVGSAPRALGTKFLVLEDESIMGTIGGGLLEHQVIKRSKKVLEEGKSSILHFQLTGENVAQTEMLCGGIVDVLLEPIFPENKTVKEVFQRATHVIQAGRKCTLLTLVAEGTDFAAENARLLIDEHGNQIGNLGDIFTKQKSEIQKWCAASKPGLIAMDSTAKAPALFVEPVQADDVLFLFGAGHISTFVAPLAKMVGFRVVVIDDRKEFANAARFPNVDQLIICPFQDAFDRISINASSYLAIITRGHIHDRAVLQTALQTTPAYIGMVGSRRKRNLIYKAIREEGASQDALDEIHSPIGLNIGAETPEEIAVSIIAEMIQVRAHGSVQNAAT